MRSRRAPDALPLTTAPDYTGDRAVEPATVEGATAGLVTVVNGYHRDRTGPLVQHRVGTEGRNMRPRGGGMPPPWDLATTQQASTSPASSARIRPGSPNPRRWVDPTARPPARILLRRGHTVAVAGSPRRHASGRPARARRDRQIVDMREEAPGVGSWTPARTAAAAWWNGMALHLRPGATVLSRNCPGECSQPRAPPERVRSVSPTFGQPPPCL